MKTYITRPFIAERCEEGAFNEWLNFIQQAENSPSTSSHKAAFPAETICAAARLYAQVVMRLFTTVPGVTEHSQVLNCRDGDCQLSHVNWQYRPIRLLASIPLRGQIMRPRLLRYGLIPARTAWLSSRVRYTDAPTLKRRGALLLVQSLA